MNPRPPDYESGAPPARLPRHSLLPFLFLSLWLIHIISEQFCIKTFLGVNHIYYFTNFIWVTIMERDILFAVVMVISAVVLTWKWLSLYNNVDAVVITSAFLLTVALSLLLLSMEYRMESMKEEYESLKRTIAVNADDLEIRFENKLRAYMDGVDERLERIERRLYR